MAINWTGGLSGGLGGAGTGASIGSLFSPVGTAVGGGIGGLLGLLGGLFGGGNEAGPDQLQLMNPQQQGILQQLLMSGLGQLQNPYGGFEPIERYAQSQFSNQMLPSIAERFTSLGSNALSSPAFASQIGQAAQGASEGLGALRAQYGQQNQQNALQQLALGMQPSFQNIYREATPGLGQQLLGNAFQAAPSIYKAALQKKALKNPGA